MLLVFLVDSLLISTLLMDEQLKQFTSRPVYRFDLSACCSRASVLLRLIRQLAMSTRASNRPLRIAEIGVGWGRTTHRVLGKLRRDNIDVRWVGIDPYFKPTAAQDRSAPLPNWVGHAQSAAKETYSHLNATLLQLTSSDSASRFGDGTFDLVFVDATHDGTDLAAWAGKVRKGGFVMGHDFSLDWMPIPRMVVTLRCGVARSANDTACSDVWLGADFTFWWQV